MPLRALLRTRLFPLLFALAALPLVGLGALFYALSLRSVESVLGQHTADVVESAIQRFDSQYDVIEQESGLPSRSLEARKFYRAFDRGDETAIQRVVEQQLRPYLQWFMETAITSYNQVIYLDADGHPVFKHDPAQSVQFATGEPIVPFTINDQQGLPAPGRKLRISVQQTAGHGSVFRFARPIRDRKAARQPPGYVLVDAPLDLLVPASPGRNISLLLLHRPGGNLLYSSDLSQLERSLDEVYSDLAQKVLADTAGTSGTLKFIHRDAEHLASFAPLGETLMAVAFVPTAPSLTEPRRTGRYGLAVPALFVLVSGALIFLLTRRVQQRTRALEEANREIQETTRRKSDFLARMSHDLRTPMNAIIGYTRLLLRKLAGSVEPRQLKNLENIETSSHNLLKLINEILDLSRVEAGRIDVKVQDVDLKQLAEECAASVEPLLAPGVEWHPQIEDVPPIRTDPDILRRVLMNLLGNAVKFTETGHVALTLHPVDDQVEISVSDTGVGIPPEDLPYIFEEFRQVERQGGTEKEGSGLGLAIARKSVELLGGTIKAASEVGKGTTFTLRIGESKHSV